MESLTLRTGRLGMVLSPLVGGAIARFWCERNAAAVELLRPTSEVDLARRDPWATACFPLVPW